MTHDPDPHRYSFEEDSIGDSENSDLVDESNNLYGYSIANDTETEIELKTIHEPNNDYADEKDETSMIAPIPLHDIEEIDSLIDEYEQFSLENEDRKEKLSLFDEERFWDLRATWLNTFNESSMTVHQANTSLSELMFIAMALMKCGKNPHWQFTPVRHFRLLNMELRYAMFRHMASEKCEIDFDYIDGLLIDCIITLVYYLPEPSDIVNGKKIPVNSEEAAYRKSLMHVSQKLEPVLNEWKARIRATKLFPISAIKDHKDKVIQKQWEECKTEEDKNKMIQRMLDEADKEPTNKGKLYWDGVDDYCDDFIPICNRFFHSMYTHRGLLEIRQPWTGAPITYHPYARKRFVAYIEDRCRYDLPGEFLNTYRNIGFELVLPVGARTERYRSLSKKFSNEPSLDILSDEIGIDTSTCIMELAEQPIIEVIKDPTHLFYYPIVLAMFDVMFQSKCQADFIKHYVLYSAELQHVNSKEKLFRNIHYGVASRPVLIRLFNKWYVICNKQRIPCDDVIDAILKWMTLIRNVYNGQLETHVTATIFPFSDLFLSDNGGVVTNEEIDKQCKKMIQQSIHPQKRKRYEFV